MHRGEDMIAIICLHTNNSAGEGIEKIETYAIYPKRGVGFSGWFSSRLAIPLFADLSADNKEFPYASGVILRLKEHKD